MDMRIHEAIVTLHHAYHLGHMDLLLWDVAFIDWSRLKGIFRNFVVRVLVIDSFAFLFVSL